MKMDRISYAGWPNCLRLQVGEIELVVTTDVGPRIIRCGFIGGKNLFKEYADQVGQSGGSEWRIYGGHRLWHAPEAKPRTYAPDNEPVNWEWDGQRLRLLQPVEPGTGIEKQIEISADPASGEIRVLHRLINHNCWAIETAAWSLTVMAPGGRFVAPQEPYRPHSEYLLPARPMALWHYTDMSDPRWVWGRRYLQLIQDPSRASPQKLGFLNRRGWALYALGDGAFIKLYEAVEGATYPDFGCNTEAFTNADMLEIETLGPMTCLPPEGGLLEHTERWRVCRVSFGDFSDAAIDRALEQIGLPPA